MLLLFCLFVLGKERDFNCLNLLLNHPKLDVTTNKEEILKEAVNAGNLKLLQCLVDAGFEPNKRVQQVKERAPSLSFFSSLHLSLHISLSLSFSLSLSYHLSSVSTSLFLYLSPLYLCLTSSLSPSLL